MESREYYLKIGSTLDEILEKFTKSEEKIIQIRPNWEFHDARRVIFRKIIQILNGFAIGFSHIHREFINPDWFNALYPKELATKENQKRLCNEFEKFLTSGLIMFLYGAVESSMRIISFELDSKKFPDKIYFSSLYSILLKDLKLGNYVDLLNIWRCLRNTIHNNGIFLSSNGKDQIIKYRNQIFMFENGKPHPIDGWEMYVSLVADLCEMISYLMESKEISSIKEIPDIGIIQE